MTEICIDRNKPEAAVRVGRSPLAEAERGAFPYAAAPPRARGRATRHTGPALPSRRAAFLAILLPGDMTGMAAPGPETRSRLATVGARLVHRHPSPQPQA